MPGNKVITPVLSTKAGYIDDVRDQISTIVRFIIMNPGWTSSLWEDDMVSFRKLASAFEGDRNHVCNELKIRCSSLFKRMYKDFVIDVDFLSEDYKDENGKVHDDGRYTIIIRIFLTKITPTGENDTTQEPALITGNIFVDPRTNDISLKYERTVDTQSFLV